MCCALARCASRSRACPFCWSKCMWCEHMTPLFVAGLLCEIAHCAAPHHADSHPSGRAISHLPPPRCHVRTVLGPRVALALWPVFSLQPLPTGEQFQVGHVARAWCLPLRRSLLKLTPFPGGFSAPRSVGGTEVLSPTAT